MAIQAQLCPENAGFAFCGSQDLMLESGCSGPAGGVGFNNNQFCSGNYLLPQQQEQKMKNQALFFDNSFVAPALRNTNLVIDNAKFEAFGDFQFQATFQDKEREEIDQFIRAQNERLRLLLQEQRKRQVVAFMKKLEARTAAMMRQKDEEIAKATTKSMELENLLRRLQMENRAWQKVAQENETMVISLNNTLEEMRERASVCLNNNSADDAESCCEETGESRGGMVEAEAEAKSTTTTTMACRICNSGNPCVLFLPCRHLCSCKQCESLLASCPVCGSPKKSSLEVLIF